MNVTIVPNVLDTPGTTRHILEAFPQRQYGNQQEK